MADLDGLSFTVSSTPTAITGLTNGTSYVAQVVGDPAKPARDKWVPVKFIDVPAGSTVARSQDAFIARPVIDQIEFDPVATRDIVVWVEPESSSMRLVIREDT